MSELISREEAIRAIEDIVAVGTFVEGMKEKCLRAIKDVPVIDSDCTDRDIKLYFDEDGTANVLNEDYVIYCANEETLEMVIEAVDKQKAKKPNNSDRMVCPVCNSKANYGIPYTDYCCHCGQKIDWSKTE